MKYTGGRCAILMAKEYRVSAIPSGVDDTLNLVGIAIVLPMPTSSLSLGFEKV